VSLEAILVAGRAEFNRRALLARKACPGLEAGSLARLLKDGLAPLVEACEAACPAKVSLVASEGFDLALRVASLGPERAGSLEGVLALWTSMARRPADWCERPGAVVGRTTNALLRFRLADGFRLDSWIEGVGGTLGEGAPLEDRAAFLAWTCGFAPLREHALAAAARLPDGFVAMALGCTEPRRALEGLASDPWWGMEPAGPRVVWKLGGFEGADGLFPEPPVCLVVEGRIVVASGGRLYRLHADRFGAMLRPVGDAAGIRADAPAPGAPEWSAEGLATPRGVVPLPFPEGDRAMVAAEGVVAVWSPLSFWLLVVAP